MRSNGLNENKRIFPAGFGKKAVIFVSAKGDPEPHRYDFAARRNSHTAQKESDLLFTPARG